MVVFSEDAIEITDYAVLIVIILYQCKNMRKPCEVQVQCVKSEWTPSENNKNPSEFPRFRVTRETTPPPGVELARSGRFAQLFLATVVKNVNSDAIYTTTRETCRRRWRDGDDGTTIDATEHLETVFSSNDSGGGGFCATGQLLPGIWQRRISIARRKQNKKNGHRGSGRPLSDFRIV